MGRKTGEEVKVEIEIGTTFYSMGALSTVSTPEEDVGKIWTTSATYISDQKNLQPIVRIDGVISGLVISPTSNYNEVVVSPGSAYIKGTKVTLASATAASNIPRPLVSGNVLITAITIDANGSINQRDGTEGSAGGSRGAAGGPPFIPIDEVLVGYVNATYYAGSASGAQAVASSEVDNESKERTFVPSYKVLYHDGEGDRDNATNAGAIELATALTKTHAQTADGPGTHYRNVYASYNAASFEELGEVMDLSFDESVEVITSRAYGDKADRKRETVPSWTGSFSVYVDRVQDVMNYVKNSTRWMKFYPDDDETEHWVARGILSVSRTFPVSDNMTASVSIEGSGRIYDKSS